MLLKRRYIKQNFLKSLSLWILLGAWGTAGAQQADSLAGYLKEAALNNPGLKAKYSLYQAALEKIPQAGSLPDPEVQFSFFLTPMELLGGDQLADIRVMQMSPWFGTLKAAKDEASKMALARYQEMLVKKNDLYLEVKEAWYQVFRIRKEIEMTEKNLALLKSLERMALIRFKAAESDNSDQRGMVGLLRVQMETGSLESRLALLADQLKTSKVRFNSFLNREKDSEVFTGDSLPEVTLPGSIATLADSIQNNPMIGMYQAEREANESRIIMAKKMGYPMIGLGLNYSVIQQRPDATSMMNGRDMIMPMVTATLPIYRKKYNALQREAGFLKDAAGESAVNATNELTVVYQESVEQLNDAERRVELNKRQASLAEKTVTLLTSAFASAGTDFEEILRMHQQLLDYQYKHIEAVVDRNTAIARLLSIISYN
jgi:outer membrane protein TolC